MQDRGELLAGAERVADRWISEERYRWHIYHTNITHLGLLRLSEAAGVPRYARHVIDAHCHYVAELREELLGPHYHMHTFGLAELELWERLQDPVFTEWIRGAEGRPTRVRHADWSPPGEGLPGRDSDCLRRELEGIVAQQLGRLLEKQPRASDGCFTFKGQDWVFVDSLAGLIPFLARAGRLLDRGQCLDEACRQIRLFADRLRDPATGLYCQGEGYGIFPSWPPRERRRTEGAWARGNGWMMLAVVELLDALPEGHPQRGSVRRILTDFVGALRGYQGQEGMWHQVVNRQDSYPELSGTCLLLYGMARGRCRGWIEEDLSDVLEKGCRAILRCVDREANIRRVCIGTPFQECEQAYCDLPAPLNDPHGHGPFLLACCELCRP